LRPEGGRQQSDEEIRKELSEMIRSTIGPIASYKETCVVKRLPKTRSGKILRGTMERSRTERTIACVDHR